MTTLTTSLIPCCTCGTIIAPNPSNQCAACLATIDIGSLVRRGPNNSDLTIYQCRTCRRFDRTGEHRLFVPLEPESPELMAVLLKQIPALSGKHSQHLRRSHGVQALQLLDSMFVWTEPHSMRMRLMLTLKADIHESPRTVSIQQRVKVEFLIRWSQCPDCTKESRQRTWQAIVQLRQKRTGDGGNDASSRKGLLVLELAIARNAELRKHILSVQTKKSGIDFYFSTLDKARHFANYMAKAAPMRTKTSQSMVSEDVRNNTANIRYTLACDMVPLCRDDLIVAEKHTARGVGRLAGRLCLVLKISSVVHLVDASPTRGADIESHCLADLNADNYWRGEKSYPLFLSSNRLVRFVVLDVELCDGGKERYQNGNGEKEGKRRLYKGEGSGVSKYALADVEVARESDFGVNDETFQCVTHLGNLLSVGDVVLGYDLTSTVFSSEAEWSMENAFNSSFVMPDVVLVRKIKGAGGAEESPSDALEIPNSSKNKKEDKKQKGKSRAKSSASKKRDKRLQKEEQKQKQLEETAARMNLFDYGKDGHSGNDDFSLEGEDYYEQKKSKLEKEVELDEDLAEDLEFVEQELARDAAQASSIYDTGESSTGGDVENYSSGDRSDVTESIDEIKE